MNDFWNYAWLIGALRAKDPEIEARIVTLNGIVFLVAARSTSATVAPLEGNLSDLEAHGLTVYGQFSLNAESDEIRAKFIDRVLSGVKSAAAPKTSIFSFTSLFGGLDSGDDE